MTMADAILGEMSSEELRQAARLQDKDGAAMRRWYRATLDTVRAMLRARQLSAGLVARVLAGIERTVDGMAAESLQTYAAQGDPVSCKAGCSRCCAQHVLISAPEAVRLALLLRQRLNHDAAAIAALRAEIQGNADSVANLDRFDRWMRKIPCPLLKDNLCSVYETRPIVCRSFFVTTPWQNCYVPNAKSSSPSEPQHVGMMIGLAVDTVLHERGLQVAQGEIAAMLAAALAPGAVEHWISGAPVFPADPTYLEVLASVHEQFAGE